MSENEMVAQAFRTEAGVILTAYLSMSPALFCRWLYARAGAPPRASNLHVTVPPQTRHGLKLLA